MHVVATAGHVDHGKSTLVTALTGVNPDRWEEERQRGLTIDLGFAEATLPDARRFSFVDVPGHIRFIRNMLAGVGSVNACCFVVDASEGWKPQSEEHLQVMELLGFKQGVIALTKADLVDAEHLEIVQLEVAERVSGTFLATAEVVVVDSISGQGLDDLRSALGRMLEEMTEMPSEDRPRLWIDRSFVLRGSGTVVTGTLLSGAIKRGDELLIYPGRKKVRVRALQTHGRTLERAQAGNRVSLNLTSVKREQLRRGNVLVRQGQWHLTKLIDASLQVLPSVSHGVGRKGAYVVYLGSGELSVRLRILASSGSETLAPGQAGAVRLYLPYALPLRPGDRYVLRESGRGETTGGGEVLDVEPCLPASRAQPDRDSSRVIAERGWVKAEELALLTGEHHQAQVGGWVVSPQALKQAKDALAAQIEKAGPLGLELASLTERERALLAVTEGVEVSGGRARWAGAGDPFENHPYLAALESQPFSPTEVEAPPARELREMQRRGVLVVRDGVVFARGTLEAAAEVASRLLADSPEGFSVSEFRQAVDSTRKYAMPLLAELDARGVTRRCGDLRVGGPRLKSTSET